MRWVGLFAVLLVGCTQPALSVDAYASSLELSADAYVADAQSLSSGYQDRVIDEVRSVLESDPDDAASRAVEITSGATTDYLSVLADDMLVFVDTMEGLNPPPEVREEHDEFVAAVRSVNQSIPATIDVVATADSIDEIRFALTSSGFADGQIRWTAACTALENAVRSMGTGIDIGCIRPEVVP